MFEMAKVLLTARNPDLVWTSIRTVFLDELQEHGVLSLTSRAEVNTLLCGSTPRWTWCGSTASLQLYRDGNRKHSVVAIDCSDWVVPVPPGWERSADWFLFTRSRVRVNGYTVQKINDFARFERHHFTFDHLAGGVRWSQTDRTQAALTGDWSLPCQVTLLPA